MIKELHSHIIPHNKALKLILAGKAIITIKNTATGNRFTYRIKRPVTPNVHDKNDTRNSLRFIATLCGTDNESAYKYFGFFKIEGEIDFDGTQSFIYKYGNEKAKIKRESQSVQAFEWVVSRLINRQPLPASIEIWHNGKCCRCGRTLTVPESIAAGIGPECERINNLK